MTTFRQYGFLALLVAALLPISGQASISGDLASGVSADQVIANALADGLTLDQVMDQIAQEVGSNNVGMFAGSAARTIAVATDASPGDPSVIFAVNAAVGAAAANNHSARSSGEAYAMNSANFAPSDPSAIRGTTGVMALSAVSPGARGLSIAAGAGGGRPGSGAPGGGAPGGGGGGGGALEDALCEAVGSEPGCLD